MKLMLWLCAPLGLLGCLQDTPIARPGPPDQGVEQSFDARPPTQTPSIGSGYGSGSSGNARSNEQDLSFEQDSDASGTQEPSEQMEDFE